MLWPWWTRSGKTLGTRMSKEFDAQIDAIVGAYKAVTDQAAQQALTARNAVAAFSKGWDACRNTIVLPTLTKIVATLAKKQVVASVAALPVGNGMGLYLPHPGRADVRGQGQPHLAIAANPNTSRVEFKHLHGAGGNDGNYTLGEITPELIEKHVLVLVRDVYR